MPAPASSAPPMHLLCTCYAPAMHLLCTSYAPLMHLLCTCYAPAMHLLCTCYAPAMHLLCTCHAPSLHLHPALCTFYACTMHLRPALCSPAPRTLHPAHFYVRQAGGMSGTLQCQQVPRAYKWRERGSKTFLGSGNSPWGGCRNSTTHCTYSFCILQPFRHGRTRAF